MVVGFFNQPTYRYWMSAVLSPAKVQAADDGARVSDTFGLSQR
jgi:hypothetical protein